MRVAALKVRMAASKVRAAPALTLSQVALNLRASSAPTLDLGRSVTQTQMQKNATPCLRQSWMPAARSPILRIWLGLYCPDLKVPLAIRAQNFQSSLSPEPLCELPDLDPGSLVSP